MSYTHLSQEERYQIYAFLKAEKTICEIAEELNRETSTISREIARNAGGRGYRPKQAHEMATKRKAEAPKAIKMTPVIVGTIEAMIKKEWSPEQVSGRLLKEEGISISHETIYKHLLTDKEMGGDLYKHLRCQKLRKKRYGSNPSSNRGQIKDRVSIDDRPEVVDKKERVGDWEGDTIIGKNHKGAIVTLVDRKSKKTLMAKVDTKDSKSVAKAINRLLRNETVHTLTLDNGKEFSRHKDISSSINGDVYFAHPYSSWERGLNENTNGLIRQYFKKGSSFEKITTTEIRRVMEKLNNRPRKALDFFTPSEVYLKETKLKQVALVT